MFLLLPLLVGAPSGQALLDAPSSALSTSSKTIYVDISLNEAFKLDADSLCFSYIDGDTVDVPLLPINGDIYKTDSPIPLSVFSEKDSGFKITITGLESVFVGSGNPLEEDGYNYVCLSADIESPSIEGYGIYSAKKENPDATYLTQRVFLYSDSSHGFYDNDSWGTSCKNAAGYLYEGIFQVITMPFVQNDDGSRYYYVDIPAEATSLHFYRMAGTSKHDFLIYEDAYIPILSYGTCYYYVGDDAGHYHSELTTGIVFNAGAVLLSYVCSAYLTYGTLASNGCKEETVKSLYDTYFANKAATTEQLKETKILDYTGYAANGNSYVNLIKNASFSLNEKWNTMCSQAGIDPKTGQSRSLFPDIGGDLTKNIVLISVSASFFLAIAIVYFVYKYRRFKRQ